MTLPVCWKILFLQILNFNLKVYGVKDVGLEAYTIYYRKGKVWSGERFLDTQIKTEFIVDMHTHPMNDDARRPFTDEQRKFFKKRFGYWIPFEATPKEQVNIMRREGIAKAVIFDAGTPSLEEAWKINQWIASVVSKYPELIGFAITPTDGSEGTDELLEESINKLKLKGVGELFPSKDFRSLEVIFEKASKLNVPVVLDDYDWDQHHGLLRNLLSSFPELKLIIPHIGHGMGEIIEIIREFDNVYTDISIEIHYYEARVAKLIREIGSDKILFGSDFPGTCWTPHDDIIRTERLPLPQEEIEKILGLNAKNLLKL
jgi:predicted TIM-barrel fold metal-dependent hydrolase